MILDVDPNAICGGISEVNATGEPLLQWQEVLRGGIRVLIRPIGEQDLELERRFLERLSPASRRFRFLDTFSVPSDALSVMSCTGKDSERS